MKLHLENKGMEQDSFSVLSRAACRHMKKRGLTLAEDGYPVVITMDRSLENDRYTIVSDAAGAVLTAGNNAALFAAFGRFLRESEFDGRGGFSPAICKTDFTPRCPLRGMYYASHNWNYYQEAPFEQIRDEIEDLALRGSNAIQLWFSMYDYTSMDDPEAERQVLFVRHVFEYADRIGMANALVMLANEPFHETPEALRAEWGAQNGYFLPLNAHYHEEICPSREGGLEEILRLRRQMLERFADLPVRYVTYNAYDEGGCTCEKCALWGVNGYLRIFPHFCDLVREFFPDAEFIVSTWGFDRFCRGEWDAFYPHLTDGTWKDVSYIMATFFAGQVPKVILEKGIPEGVKFIDFPEISMHAATPWGGFGANPQPAYLQKLEDESGHYFSGGFPYSEGLFEDINKFIVLSRYSGYCANANEAVRAYVKYEFCLSGEALDEMTDAVIRSESSLLRGKKYDGPSAQFPISDPAEVGHFYEVMEKYNRILPEAIRTHYRFRTLYLRAVIDREMVKADYYPLRSAVCQEAMRELDRIYCVQEKTGRFVRTPLGQ